MRRKKSIHNSRTVMAEMKADRAKAAASHLSPITAKDVIALLAVRHSDDVFVPECKDGPTWGGSHLRLDAWAMRRSWSKPCCFGYEVKVSRSDFVNHEKAHHYLGLCNQFYFVAPKGLIEPNELPSGAGLLVVAGGRLLTKVKAPHRDVVVPEDLWRYILMSRVQVKPRNAVDTHSADERRRDRMQVIADFAADRRLRKALAETVRSRLASHCQELQRRVTRLERYRHLTGPLDSGLRKLGVDWQTEGEWRDWKGEGKVRSYLHEISGDLSQFYRDIEGIIDRGRSVVEQLETHGVKRWAES